MALAIFLTGVPLIYYLRDGLGVAPGNTMFSIGLIFFPFALTIPFKNFRFFDLPNKVTFPYLTFFLIYLFAYFFLKDRYYLTVSFYTEILTYIIIVFVAFSTVFMRNEAINRRFIYLCILLSTLSAISLMYYVSQNPLYVIGQRAAFGYGGEVGVGNPHINSKVAYFGIILGVLSLKYYRQIKLGLIFPVILIILNIAILFLTQTMLAFLATFGFTVMFLVFNLSFSNAVSTFRLFFTKWYIVVLVLAGFMTLSYQINKNARLLNPAFNYFNTRFEGIKKSLTESSESKKIKVKETGDDSANTRIQHVEGVMERLEKSFDKGNYHYILFGQGYKFMYVDIPHLEMIDSFGLIGFTIFTILFLRLILMSVREMRDPESIGTEFLAYAMIYFFIANFTSGQMLDYTRFASFYIFCRFLKK
ncbi:hypothetical protein Lbys_0231 [Leadbetterella byssophila DSM 17132]|jgi:hypothetical protein|uniref:O-antigen polymerase n=2 Tax=Leadbetterella TaxID=319458 RepID=E4RU43_LEAB4|nr:hypothetical protein Lbys_0231 [Leadbetterella byssophila DSM 17132]